MRVTLVLWPRTAAAFYRQRMRVRLAALLGVTPALGEGACRITQAFGAQAILDQGLGHGQAVGLGGAPTIG